MSSSKLMRERVEKVRVRLQSPLIKLHQPSHFSLAVVTQSLCRTKSGIRLPLHPQVINRLNNNHNNLVAVQRLKLCQLQLSDTSPRRKALTSTQCQGPARMGESPRLTSLPSLRVATEQQHLPGKQPSSLLHQLFALAQRSHHSKALLRKMSKYTKANRSNY